MSQGQFLTPTKAARGLGSAKSGTAHHIRLRVAALALLVLVPLALYAIISISSASFDGARAWVAQPLHATLLILTAGVVSYHMRLGMQVIIEDYIHGELQKVALLILSTFFTILVAGASLFALLKIAFAG